MENKLRLQVGLRPAQPLHAVPPERNKKPGPKEFARQADAVDFRASLIASGAYEPRQLGVFAREVGKGGVRKFLVDTYAGFVKWAAPEFDPYDRFSPLEAAAEIAHQLAAYVHYYEVILEDHPCWWYFDLEYATKANPGLVPALVAQAFRETLAGFCEEVLGAALDESSLLELESSTESKFSLHVIVKRLRRAEEAPVGLAFANNAQVGLLTRHFLDYARHLRENDFTSLARLLFINAPQDAGGDSVAAREVSLVDESVYSRNRCFRLLYNSKYGKNTTLRLAGGACNGEAAVLRLLGTMASFVPDGVPLFQHPLIPADFGHVAFMATRPVGAAAGGGLAGGSSDRASGRPVDVGSISGELLRHLIDSWDRVRWANENVAAGRTAPTRVASCVRAGDDGRFLLITLLNNRFCFCKGKSHRSNSIFLVVDAETSSFYQKCHDRSDCGPHFKSPSFEIPGELCPRKELVVPPAAPPAAQPLAAAAAAAAGSSAALTGEAQRAALQLAAEPLAKRPRVEV